MKAEELSFENSWEGLHNPTLDSCCKKKKCCKKYERKGKFCGKCPKR